MRKLDQLLSGEPLRNRTAYFSILRFCLDQIHNLLLHCRVGSKVENPVDLRLAAKPRHLPLGIVSVSLLCRSNGLLK